MFLRNVRRFLYTETKQWPQQLTRDVIQDIERKWINAASAVIKNGSASEAKKAYILAMFPYPSGNLHMGHVRVYTISDVMARYNMLKGNEVLHPMGWDAFGLPAENAAKERKLDPVVWTAANVEVMRRQLGNLCLTLDWSRCFSTADPSYYKWTQWLFVKLFQNGLAYQRTARVFWDPVDKTVLAAEQVDQDGRSWRSGAKVEYKYLKQWYLRTTAFAKQLRDNLDNLNPSFWKEVIDLQRGWIGNCDGCRVDFSVVSRDSSKTNFSSDYISVFTRTPELVYGVSHIVISPEHHLASQAEHLTAVNPLTGKHVPFVINPGGELEPDVDARLGIPALSSTFDKDTAVKLGVTFENVLSEDETVVKNSGPVLSDKPRKEAFEIACKLFREKGIGGHLTSAKLDDWLVSRQRYWGTPIPVVHCPVCGPQPVAEADLPVLLPPSNRNCSEVVHCACPKCKNPTAYRDTDTLDTFVDSSWYFLRFPDPANSEKIFDPNVVNKWLPVDLYVGGREHAIMHLYFARFICYFLHDLGLLKFKEPFTKLLTQGMVYGRSFKEATSLRYLRPEEVKEKGKDSYISKESGKPVVASWEKMSKSKYNGVDPQAVLDKYGVDSVRTCVVANVAPKSTRKWSEDQFIGVVNWERKMWSLFGDFLKNASTKTPVNSGDLAEQEAIIREFRNYFVKEVSFHMEVTYLLNTAISRLQGFTTSLRKVPAKCYAHSKEFSRALTDLLVMVSPFAPCLTLEMWQTLLDFSKNQNFALSRDLTIPLHSQQWPVLDQDFVMSLVVKVGSVEVGALPITYGELNRISAKEAADMVLNSELVKSPKMLEAAGVQISSDKYSYLYEKNYRGIVSFPK